MIVLAAKDYGQLGPLVLTVGTIVSATAAILMGFRGRAKWEPSEEDVAKGPQQVASLLAAIAIVAMWVTRNDPKQIGWLTSLAIWYGVATAIFLLLYGWLISVYAYRKIGTPETGVAKEMKIIGGFMLTAGAKDQIKARAISVQQLFAGRGYDEDLVWTRASRAAAKTLFVLSYLGLTLCGVMALAATGMMLLLYHPPLAH